MTSVAWPLLIVAALFLIIGIYFILGRTSIAAAARDRRDQVNKIRPKDRQLPPSATTTGRIAAGGIALTVIGVLWLVLFAINLFRQG